MFMGYMKEACGQKKKFFLKKVTISITKTFAVSGTRVLNDLPDF